MIKKSVYLILALAVGLSSCNSKEGCTDTAASNFNNEANSDDGSCEYKTNLILKFDAKVGDESLEYDKVYTDASTGVNFKYSLAQFYVSGISLLDEAGNATESFSDVYLLVKPGDNAYTIGEIESGNKHMLSFDVGIDEATNTQTESDFVSRASDDPLSLQTPTMHWSWMTGYIFMKVEGEADLNADGIMDTTFYVHPGLNELRTRANVMLQTNAIATEDFEVTVSCDFKSIFIDGLNNPPSSHTLGGSGTPEQNRATAQAAIQAFAASFKKE